MTSAKRDAILVALLIIWVGGFIAAAGLTILGIWSIIAIYAATTVVLGAIGVVAFGAFELWLELRKKD